MTIVEVVVSLTIFTFVMLVFAATVPLAEKTARANSQHAQAVSLCQHKIDQLRAVGYGRLTHDELSDAGIIDLTPATQPFRFTGVDDVQNYLPASTSSLRIEPVTSHTNITSPESKMVKVTVSITWKPSTHKEKTTTTTLTAFINNTGE